MKLMWKSWGGKKLFFKNRITPVDLDQKQEPKTEDKTQNATHEANVKIAGGKKHFFKNKITPVDLDQKLDYWNQNLKTRQRLQHMKPIWKSLVEKSISVKNKITRVHLDQKQEPKTEEKTQNATHEANVTISVGEKHFFK